MVRCLVNEALRPIDSGPKTWGDLLASLDGDEAASGRAVTAVRFDGVDQPTFRGDALGQVPLTALETIEVECVDRQQLLQSVLATAQHSLPSLATSARRLADMYRAADVEAGRQQLGALIATIRTLTELTMASVVVADLGLAETDGLGESGTDVLGVVAVALETVSQHHEAADWLGVAEALEHGLAPALLQWGVVFEAMQTGCAA